MNEFSENPPEIDPCEVVEAEMLSLSVVSEKDPVAVYKRFKKRIIEVNGTQIEVIGLRENDMYYNIMMRTYGRQLTTIQMDRDGRMYTYNTNLNNFERNRRLLSGMGRFLIKEIFANI